MPTLTLPYDPIAKIDNRKPVATPDLWNTTYSQVDANFAAVKSDVNGIHGSVSALESWKAVTADPNLVTLFNDVTGINNSLIAVWAAINAMRQVPVGTIIAWATYSGPAGYLECNGSAQLIAMFPALYAVLGTMYGGNGTTTFCVPDYRGEFLRGYDNNRGYDPGRALGVEQGFSTAVPVVQTPARGFLGQSVAGAAVTVNDPDALNSGSEPDLGMFYAGDSETRPHNMSVIYLIKA